MDIFILASRAFAHSAETNGAIDATVNLTLHIHRPDNLLLAGIFVPPVSSLYHRNQRRNYRRPYPVAVGLAEKTEIAPLYGSRRSRQFFFGTTLSFISRHHHPFDKNPGMCNVR